MSCLTVTLKVLKTSSSPPPLKTCLGQNRRLNSWNERLFLVFEFKLILSPSLNFEQRLLRIFTSFWVLRASKSWSKYFLQHFTVSKHPIASEKINFFWKYIITLNGNKSTLCLLSESCHLFFPHLKRQKEYLDLF